MLAKHQGKRSQEHRASKKNAVISQSIRPILKLRACFFLHILDENIFYKGYVSNLMKRYFIRDLFQEIYNM